MSKDKTKTLRILGVPLDHGAGRRGVGMGPSAVRIARLPAMLERIGYSFVDEGDVHVPAPETQPSGEVKAKYLPLITKVCSEVATQVKSFLDDGDLPLVIGGDHSIAIGSISGVASHLKTTKKTEDASRLGVIWFDAHADINTPATTPSGNIHGMPVSCLLGDGPSELTQIEYDGAKMSATKVVQIGLRDLDEREKELLKASGVHTFTMADIDKRGMATIMADAIEIATSDTDMLHVSFDIDSLDPRIAPGTGTTKIGGLTYREAHLGLEMIASTKRLTSLDMVEVNPTLDLQNQTAELAVELIASALGKRIL